MGASLATCLQDEVEKNLQHQHIFEPLRRLKHECGSELIKYLHLLGDVKGEKLCRKPEIDMET
jgi:hypothetical protein